MGAASSSSSSSSQWDGRTTHSKERLFALGQDSLPVVFHRRNLFHATGGLLHHDWVQVGHLHFEISGDATQTIVGGLYGSNSPCEPPNYSHIVGTTQRTSAEIAEFNSQWIQAHPQYRLMDGDCQKHARDFTQFLCHVNLDTQEKRDGWFV